MLFFRKILIIIAIAISCTFSYAQNTSMLSTTVEFVVDTDIIIQNDNYNYFLNTVIPAIAEKSDYVETILLIGSASPEGQKSRNLYLADIRADKIYSHIKTIVPKSKIEVVNDYDFFLKKTGLTEEDYRKLRATYVEVHFKEPEPSRDTVYIRDTISFYRVDTVLCCRVDTVYIKEEPKVIPVVAVKSNLASDLLATPNVQAEVYTYLWGLSLEFDYTFPWYHKDYNSYFYYQILNGIVGIRKYLNTNDYVGHWFGVYANTAIYDICFWNKTKGWQGELHGAGLSYGYVFRSKKYPRVKFEPYVRLGWMNTRFDTYHASDPWDEKYYYNWYSNIYDFIPRRFNMNYFGPTSIGFNLTFDLICIRKY